MPLAPGLMKRTRFSRCWKRAKSTCNSPRIHRAIRELISFDNQVQTSITIST